MFENLKDKKLYRSPKDGLLFGVASGLAHYFDVDVVFVRIGMIVLALLTHIWWFVIAYFLAFFLMPVDPSQESVAQHQVPKDVTGQPASEDKMDSTQNM